MVGRNRQRSTASAQSGPFVLNEGKAEGTIIGGNLSTLGLLQGTEYFPDLKGAVLFIEDDWESSAAFFDRDLQSLLHLPAFPLSKRSSSADFSGHPACRSNGSNRSFEQKKSFLPYRLSPIWTLAIPSPFLLFQSEDDAVSKLIKARCIFASPNIKSGGFRDPPLFLFCKPPR